MLKKIVNFGIVGVIATIIDFGVLFVLKSLCNVDVYIATTLAFIVSLIFNFVASMKYVFKAKEGMSVTKQCIVFVVTAVIGLGINEAIMYLCIEFLSLYYMIGKLLATCVVMVFNFVSRHLLLE